MARTTTDRKLLAILSGDVVDYTRLMATDEDRTIASLARNREMIEVSVSTHEGRIVDFVGDNFLAEFPSARDALDCAASIQRRLNATNRELPDDDAMHFRIGAHVGDIRVQDGRLYGDGVNVAARLEALAEPGGICVSRQVLDLVGSQMELQTHDLGEKRVKNFPRPVHAYHIDSSALELAPEEGSAGDTELHGSRSMERLVRQQLGRLLASDLFKNSARQRRFLSYVVEKALNGEENLLKGYPIGLDVFDRRADFDPATDSIVRVEASRMRSKLREYYAEAGRDDEIVIALPKGSYVPTWSEHGGASSSSAHATTGVGMVPAITVMPFANLSNDPEQEYFGDGIAEDIIHDLSRIAGLKVIARHSAFAYKDKNLTAHEIGAELGLKYLVVGSVRRAGNRIRLTVDLIDADSDAQIWANRYDRELDDIFALQDEIVAKIIDSLRDELSQREEVVRPAVHPVSFEAHDLLARGRDHFWTYDPKKVEKAIGLFEEAIAIAPDYPLGNVWIARAVVFRFALDWTEDRGVLDESLAHVRKALELDPSLPIAHGMLCWVQMWRKEIDEAIRAGERAIQLGPSDADAHVWYAMALVSANRGRDGLAQAEVAASLSPYPQAIHFFALGLSHWVLDDYTASVEILTRGIERFPRFTPFYVTLALHHVEHRAPEKALETHRQFLSVRSEGQLAGHQESYYCDPGLAERFQNAMNDLRELSDSSDDS